MTTNLVLRAPVSCTSDADFLISDSGNESKPFLNADPDLRNGFLEPKSVEKYGG
jgi:hypothetical protein